MDHQGNKRQHVGGEEHQRPSKQQEVVQRLHVHDSIVARSLSHMPLLDVVQTTERFGDKWLSMPRLVFDDIFVEGLEFDHGRIDNAITAILRDHQASIEEFEFTIREGYHYKKVPDYLTLLTNRNPIFMKIIKLDSPRPISISMELLSPFKQLKELQLLGCQLIDAEGCDLNQLKLLHLGEVSVPTLRKVLISNPGLLSLALFGTPTTHTLESNDSLQLGEFVSLLPNVQVLSLSKYFSELLVQSGGPPNSGIYNHLITLKICVKVEHIAHVTWAFSMLKASPNLRSLYVTFVDDDQDVTVEDKVQSLNYLKSEEDLECLSNVASFNITNVSDPNNIVRMMFIQKLLNHTPNLEKGNVTPGDLGDATDQDILRKLSKMSRLSRKAKLYSSVLDLWHLN